MEKEILFKDYTYVKYYSLIISPTSYKYITYMSKIDMETELNTSHSVTNIIKLVLSTINEPFDEYSGELNDTKFELSQNRIKTIFKQDINRMTMMASNLSSEFDNYMKNKGQ